MIWFWGWWKRFLWAMSPLQRELIAELRVTRGEIEELKGLREEIADLREMMKEEHVEVKSIREAVAPPVRMFNVGG
jgi:hypothetical protein